VSWSLYFKDKFLPPIDWKYGNQEKSVHEILDAISSDNDERRIVLYMSLCGSGKSATLLNVIKEIGRGIIVVPTLNLQSQYYDSYGRGDNKYVLKSDKTKLKIGTMIGRNNFICRYLKDKVDRGETLVDDIIIFDKSKISCATNGLPCNRILRRGVSRILVASECPYYIPPPRLAEDIDKWENDIFEDEEISKLDLYKERLNCEDIKYYCGVDGNDYGLFVRKDINTVCDYYRQFYNYLDEFCDVIIFNNWKWHIETHYGRKPLVDIECFDEADHFLSLLNKSIRISTRMIDNIYKSKSRDDIKSQRHSELSIEKIALLDYFNCVFDKIKKGETKKNDKLIDYDLSGKIENYIKKVIDIQDKTEASKISGNVYDVLRSLSTIKKYIDKCTLSVENTGSNKIITYNIPYPDLILRDLLKKSCNKILMMSATMYSADILDLLFGLKFDKIIMGRIDQPGTLNIVKPKNLQLVDVTYSNWMNDEFRKYYNNLLKYIVLKLNVKGNTLVLTPSKKYTDDLVQFLKYKKTKASIDFSDDKYDCTSNGTENKITISYRMKRGSDLVGDNCRVLIWAKYPLMDINDGYVKALFDRFGNATWRILNDIATRDVIQGVCRGLRNDNDWEIFCTPDIKVFNIVHNWWKGQKLIKEQINRRKLA